MAFQISPGVNVSEFDQTTTVPAVATTVGAVAGHFRWGPVDSALLISSEKELVNRFGAPSASNYETFFTAASFLSYGNQLYVVRAANTTANVLSAVANSAAVANVAAQTVKNVDAYDAITFDANAQFVAKYAGDLGNSLKISVCTSNAAYSANIDFTNISDLADPDAFNGANTLISFTVGSANATVVLDGSTATAANTYADTVRGLFSVGDLVEVGNTTIGKQYMKVTSVGAATYSGSSDEDATFTITFDSVYKLSTAYSATSIVRKWEFFNQFDSAPGTSQFLLDRDLTAIDELHIVVVDEDGKFSGVPGTILEKWSGLSRATDARTSDGADNYYKTVLKNSSQWVYAASNISGAATAVATSVATDTTNDAPFTKSFVSGTDGSITESNVDFGSLARAYDIFATDYDISLVMTGKARGGTHGEQLANYLIDNLAEVRKDCMVFVSPAKEDVVNAPGSEGANVVQFRGAVRSSSYAVHDSGYKYAYDRYNDVYRWVPLNGDIAGVCAYTDSVRDPWFSPAGTSRGIIRNVVKLAYNPNKADRDLLYKSGVNPVISEQGKGTLLFGDKTLSAKPNAFDRINVRRLFIVLEKAIAQAAETLLFEFNDEFTRSQFVSIVEPYLRDVEGRRGITDFQVVCDESNNTDVVIDSNRFVGDIFVRPNRSINFIQLNFIAARTGVEFTEIVGVG